MYHVLLSFTNEMFSLAKKKKNKWNVILCILCASTEMLVEKFYDIIQVHPKWTDVQSAMVEILETISWFHGHRGIVASLHWVVYSKENWNGEDVEINI